MKKHCSHNLMSNCLRMIGWTWVAQTRPEHLPTLRCVRFLFNLCCARLLVCFFSCLLACLLALSLSLSRIANPFSPHSIQKRPEPQICPSDCFWGFQSGGLEFSDKICQNLSENYRFLFFCFWQNFDNFSPRTGTPQNNRWDKFWTNLGFGAFLNAVRGKRVRNSRSLGPDEGRGPKLRGRGAGSLFLLFWSLFLTCFCHFFARLLLPDSFYSRVKVSSSLFFFFGHFSWRASVTFFVTFLADSFCRTPFAAGWRFPPLSFFSSNFFQPPTASSEYHPGQNYYKRIPWNNYFCNIFVVFFSRPF